jgi:hypothetical protein
MTRSSVFNSIVGSGSRARVCMYEPREPDVDSYTHLIPCLMSRDDVSQRSVKSNRINKTLSLAMSQPKNKKRRKAGQTPPRGRVARVQYNDMVGPRSGPKRLAVSCTTRRSRLERNNLYPIELRGFTAGKPKAQEVNLASLLLAQRPDFWLTRG